MSTLPKARHRGREQAGRGATEARQDWRGLCLACRPEGTRLDAPWATDVHLGCWQVDNLTEKTRCGLTWSLQASETVPLRQAPFSGDSVPGWLPALH